MSKIVSVKVFDMNNYLQGLVECYALDENNRVLYMWRDRDGYGDYDYPYSQAEEIADEVRYILDPSYDTDEYVSNLASYEHTYEDETDILSAQEKYEKIVQDGRTPLASLIPDSIGPDNIERASDTYVYGMNFFNQPTEYARRVASFLSDFYELKKGQKKWIEKGSYESQVENPETIEQVIYSSNGVLVHL